MKINNAFELEQWRDKIKKLLKSVHLKDNKKGFIIYLKLHMPGLYKEIKKHLPENITDWSWKQIAELTN